MRFTVYDYPNDRNFYKRLEHSLKVLRKLFPELNEKFDDPTRKVSLPPLSESKIELWLEKSSLEYFLKDLAEKYRVPTLAERRFGSITMFVRAVERARKRGLRKILFVSDHDPSGLLIGEITKKEMTMPLLEVERIALTDEQIKKYNLPSITVKKSDSRAKKYIKTYGNRAWEVESLPPRVLFRIVENKIKENLTSPELQKIKIDEKAARAVEPLERELIEKLRKEATELASKKKGISKEDILTRLRKRFRRFFQV